jgi:hypothetical protein
MKMDWLEGLRKMQGNYSGGGKNHEGETFTSSFRLEVCEGGKGIAFTYRAEVGKLIVHDEKSILGRDDEGRLSIFALTSNTPAVMKHSFAESSSRRDGDAWSLAFEFGDFESRNGFRERLVLRFHTVQGHFGYDYHWGMPGKDFGLRSSSEMKRDL